MNELEVEVRKTLGDLMLNNMGLRLENAKLKIELAAMSKPEPEAESESDPVVKYEQHHGVTADIRDGN